MINQLIDYLVKSFNIPRQAIATILISLSTFILGILINNAIISFNKFFQRRIHRTLSQINYKLLLKNVYKQQHDFFNFKEQLIISHFGPFDYNYKIMPALDVFNKLGYENLYKAYFRGIENFTLFRNRKKLSAFNNLWTSIEYLNHIQKDSFEKVENFIAKNSDLNDLRNQSLGKAQNIVEEFRIHFNRELTIKEPLGVFFSQREQIIKDYREEKDFNLPDKTEVYVNKLLNLNRDNVNIIQRYERDIHAVELNSYLLESSYRFENMKNHIESVNYYFAYLSTSYLETYIRLKRYYSILNPSKIRVIKNSLVRVKHRIRKIRPLKLFRNRKALNIIEDITK